MTTTTPLTHISPTMTTTTTTTAATTNSPNTMTHLLLWLFILYGVFSFSVAAIKSGELTQERLVIVVSGIIVVAYFFLFDAVEIMQPELLRLFGAGGQGFLHLLSLRFVDPRELSFVGVFTRVLAGSYTAILAAVFFVPLMGALLVFIWNLYDAFEPFESTTTTTTTTTRNHHASQSPHPTTGGGDNNIQPSPIIHEEERWLLKEFDMTKFHVLCSLGKGVTSRVVLAKVIRHQNEITPAITQTGLLWNSRDDNDGGGGGITTHSPGTAMRLQSGNLWDASSMEPSSPFTIGPSALPPRTIVTSPTPPLLPPVRRTSISPAFGPANILSHTSITDMHDMLLDTLLLQEYNTTTPTAAATTTRNPSGGNIPSMPSRVNIRASESIMNLRDMAGPDVDEWRPKPQFLDADQRKKSQMDDVFTVAPGLTSVPRNISDFSLSARVVDEVDRPPSVPSSAATSLGLLNNGLSRDDMLNGTSVVIGGGGTLSSSDASLSRSPKLPSVKFATSGSRTRSMSSGDSLTTTDEDRNFGGGEEPHRTLVDGLDAMPELVAVKIMCKADIERMGMKRTVENERKALASCASPFICNILGAFQDSRWAYLLLEPVPAGDLAGLLEQRQVMFEDEARFYVGCLLLALEHLHHRGITCLDVKPENMLLDQWGYCKLCDFGIARVWKHGERLSQEEQQYAGTKWEFVGTPEYMSPEVVERQVIDKGVGGVCGPDLWATGVLLFELLVGEPPFAAQTNVETLGLIKTYVRDHQAGRYSSGSRGGMGSRWGRAKSGDADDDDNDMVLQGALRPLARVNKRAAALICRLLRPSLKTRLGCQVGGARAVMENAWFRDLDWDALRQREMRAPFIPNPLTLAPPFRGEDVDLDFTKAQPMSIAEVQEIQGKLKAREMSRDSLAGSMVGNGGAWKGFLQVKGGGGGGATSGKDTSDSVVAYQKKLAHFKELFRDDDDDV